MDGSRENIYSRRRKVPRSSQILKQRTYDARAQKLTAAEKKPDQPEEEVDDAIKDGESIRNMGQRTLDKPLSPYQNAGADEPIKSDEPDRAIQRKIEEIGSDLSLD